MLHTEETNCGYPERERERERENTNYQRDPPRSVAPSSRRSAVVLFQRLVSLIPLFLSFLFFLPSFLSFFGLPPHRDVGELQGRA